jgi:FAD-linked sulfhydryl oxidase
MKQFYVVCLVISMNLLILVFTIGGTGELPIHPTAAASTGISGRDTYSRATREAEPDTNFVEYDEAKITREQLGHATWTMLHTIAAYFPTEPTPIQIQSAKDLLYGIADTFACRICGEHFTQLLKGYPPTFSNRDEFVMYLCEVHN